MDKAASSGPLTKVALSTVLMLDGKMRLLALAIGASVFPISLRGLATSFVLLQRCTGFCLSILVLSSTSALPPDSVGTDKKLS